MKTILVTGGAGFIGSHLCERLVKDGHTVISLDNYFTGSEANHVAGVDYRKGHTKDITKLVPETPDLIYHLGEYSRVEQSVLEPELVHDLNTVGTLGVVEFWHKKKCKLIYAGSSTKFGDSGATRTTSPYASTKAANTERVKKEGDEKGLPYAITYFYNVYGPGERAGIYGTVIETFKQMYLQGAPLAVVAPGTQMRNFTHVDDIVGGLMLVGEKGMGDEFGLGNSKSFSIREVAHFFTDDVVMLPERFSNRMQSSLDVSKATALGWKTKRSLEEYISTIITQNNPKTKREKRVLLFSTTFFPVEGPAERALRELVEKLPDVQFDIVTSSFTLQKQALDLPNLTVYHVGVGHSIDKYLLPFLGYRKASMLSKKHSYLFTWALMASYGALAGVFLKWVNNTPLLVTLADQNIKMRSMLTRTFLALILRSADQTYGIDADQEEQARNLSGLLQRHSLGVGDAFANQLRYVYVDIFLKQKA